MEKRLRFDFVVLILVLAFVCADANAGLLDCFNPKPVTPRIGEDFDNVNKASQDLCSGPLVKLTGVEGINFKNANVNDTQIDHRFDRYEIYGKNSDLDSQTGQFRWSGAELFVFKDKKLVLNTSTTQFRKDAELMLEKEKQKEDYGADYDVAIKYSRDFGILPSMDTINELHKYKVNNVNDLAAAEAEFQKYSPRLYRNLQLTTYLQDRETATQKSESIEQAAKDRTTEEEKRKAEHEKVEEQRRAEQEKAEKEQAKKDKLAQQRLAKQQAEARQKANEEATAKKAKADAAAQTTWYVLSGSLLECDVEKEGPAKTIETLKFMKQPVETFDEEKEGDTIVSVKVRFGTGYIYYIRGRDRCNAVARSMKNADQNEVNRYKDRYK